jgi:hypothetical protein
MPGQFPSGYTTDITQMAWIHVTTDSAINILSFNPPATFDCTSKSCKFTAMFTC